MKAHRMEPLALFGRTKKEFTEASLDLKDKYVFSRWLKDIYEEETVFSRTHWEVTKVCFSWISIYCKEGVGDEIRESVAARTDQKSPCQTCQRFWSLHAR